MKPTGKKTQDEVRVYIDTSGEVVGLAHEVTNVEEHMVGKKPIELGLNQEAVSGRKTDESIVLPPDVRTRIMDRHDPLRPQDLDVKGGGIRIKDRVVDHRPEKP